jgi:hypothetical protein
MQIEKEYFNKMDGLNEEENYICWLKNLMGRN